MCGIVGYIGSGQAQEILLEGLKRLAYRGYDSCGIATYSSGELVLRKALGKVSNLETLLNEQPAKGSVGIGHTRWATHGRPSLVNAHPIRVGACLVVHNGIIENYAELKDELLARGKVFETDTDTEIIAQLIEEGVRSGKSPEESLEEALGRLRGSYAILLFCLFKSEALFLAKKDLPLVVGRGSLGLFASSDTFAITPFADEIGYVPDGAVVVLQGESPKVFREKSGAKPFTFERLLVRDMDMEKKGFKHFLLKEIFEQPLALMRTLEAYVNKDLVAFDFLTHLENQNLKDLEVVYLIGCGTAYHAAMLGKRFFQEFAGIEAVSESASEFRLRGYLNPKSCGVLISQSGETADTLAALKMLQKAGIPSFAITNVAHSTLARSTSSLLTKAGPEVSVASTKAFTTQVLVLYLLALWLGLKKGRMDPLTLDSKLSTLKGLAASIDQALNLFPVVQKLAGGLLDDGYLVYLGRGPFMPLALEGALKIKEIAYVHAEGYPAGEMKHGPIALIEPGVHVIALLDANDGIHRDKMLATIEEMCSRGAEVLLVHTGQLDKACAFPTLALPSVDCPFLATIPVAVMLQLLAYAVAVLKGTDVDQPRNLAKSVTVE
jgi:glucosamine--fructose-6-phosphate aminotransferase (isomerizing)